MTNVIYTATVERLLTLGDEPIRREPTPGYYAELGLTLDDADELRRMALDDRLHTGPWDDDRLYFAPLHAWRAMLELGCDDALHVLLRAIHDDPEDEWLNEEIIRAAPQWGARAIEPMVRLLRDAREHDYSRSAAAECLGKIGCKFPELRAECMAHLAAALEAETVDGAGDTPEQIDQRRELNAIVISALIALRAIEAGETIRRAFEAGAVAECFCGDWEHVEADLQRPPGEILYEDHFDEGFADSPEFQRVWKRAAQEVSEEFASTFAYGMLPEEREQLREQRKKEAKAAARAKQKAKAAKKQKKRNRR